jgi:hypothetical protein
MHTCRRAIENKHEDLNRERSMNDVLLECSCRTRVSARRFNVGRVLVLNEPPQSYP